MMEQGTLNVIKPDLSHLICHFFHALKRKKKPLSPYLSPHVILFLNQEVQDSFLVHLMQLCKEGLSIRKLISVAHMCHGRLSVKGTKNLMLLSFHTDARVSFPSCPSLICLLRITIHISPEVGSNPGKFLLK